MFNRINAQWTANKEWSCTGHHPGRGLFGWLRRTTVRGVGGAAGLLLHVQAQHPGSSPRTSTRQTQRAGDGSVQIQIGRTEK